MAESQIIAQRDFSAGQVDESALRSDDLIIVTSGCRQARNVRILNTRGLQRRPGRRWLFATTGIADLIRPVPDQTWFIILESGSVTFRRRDFASEVTFWGMPWDAQMLRELRWVESSGTVVVAHQDMVPRAFTYVRATEQWTSSVFSFAQDQNGHSRQPFYAFNAGTGYLMSVSGRAGMVSVNFSGPVLDSQHAYTRFRWAGRQIMITAVHSPYSATAVVIELLPPSYIVRLENTSGLEVGDIVEGITSGARGQVVGVPNPEHMHVIVTTNWSGFQIDEYVAGPRTKAKVVAQSEQPPFATTQWDEALMSTFRGWPGVVAKDSQRLIFSRFPQLGPSIAWSAIGTVNDFKIGAAPSDAFMESVPENCIVQDILGGSDEFIFTDRGTYFIPISAASPLAPGGIELRKISDDAAAPIRPRETNSGLCFVNAGKTRVLAITATGQTARPYVVEDTTEFHSQLINGPVAMASTSSDVSAPERYLYVVNSDGQLAVSRYQRTDGKSWAGWVPWEGKGKIQWVSASGADVVVTVEYETTAGTIRSVEVFDDSLLLDASRAIASLTGASALELNPGEPLELEQGDPLILEYTYAFGWMTGTELSVESNGWYRGDFTILEDGSLSGSIPVQNVIGLTGGFNFDVVVEPFVPHVEGGQSKRQRMRPRRIKQVAATVLHSQAFEVAGRLIPFWRGSENQEIAPPVRSKTYRSRILGRDFDPRWEVSQTVPGLFRLLELTTEVTF